MSGKAKDLPSAVTADEVADLAGVSRWTVNRAFKRGASISEKNRKKVLEAAERLGYVPDLLAASLGSDRSNLVALLVDDFSNPHKLVMMERLTRILRKNGWDTLLINTLDENDASAALLSASQRRVDAAGEALLVDASDVGTDGVRRNRQAVGQEVLEDEFVFHHGHLLRMKPVSRAVYAR